MFVCSNGNVQNFVKNCHKQTKSYFVCLFVETVLLRPFLFSFIENNAITDLYSGLNLAIFLVFNQILLIFSMEYLADMY
jgi:hypothetical protein